MKQLFLLLLFFAGDVHADTSSIWTIFVKAHQVQNTDPDSAFRLASEGFNLSIRSNYTRGTGMAFMRFGSIMRQRGQNDSALFYYRKALQIRKQLQDYGAVTAVWREMSYVFSETGRPDSAFYCLFEALRYFPLTGDSIELGNTYFDLGTSNISYKEKKSAWVFLKKAEIIFTRIGSKPHLNKAWAGLGDYYFNNGEYKKAAGYFLRVDSLSSLLNDGVEMARCKNNLALCYENLEQHTLAEKYYADAAKLYEEYDMQNSLALLYANIGNHFIRTKNYSKALLYLQKGERLAQTTGDTEKLLFCYELLSDAYALQENFLKAYEYHLQYTALSDSLLNEAKVESIAEMQTKYETEKKEQQISLLDAQHKTKLAQRNFFIAGSIILMVLLLALGIYYMQKRRIAKKNEQIARQQIETLLNEQEIKTYNAMMEGQEEERKRIAADLHDRLGSMLSTVKLLFGALDMKIDKAQGENKQQYENIHTLLDDAVSEVRKISHNLSTGMVMSFGLIAALQELCDSINKSGLIECRLAAQGINERFDQQTEITVYRIVQELISNILKHAKAEQIVVQLTRQNNTLTLVVEDDGVGFDINEKKNHKGMGLKNIDARASQLHASYHVNSKPGAGTIFIFTIPLIPESL